MAYTPYYSGGWQSGEQGGTPITPAALNNIESGIGTLDTTHNLKTYTSVAQLNLTAGSATILTAFNALPVNSMLVARETDFASTEVPNQFGFVEMIKSVVATRTSIHFRSKYATNGQYVMYLGATAYNGNDENLPSGDWMREVDGNMLQTNLLYQRNLDDITYNYIGYADSCTATGISSNINGTLIASSNNSTTNIRASQIIVRLDGTMIYRIYTSAGWQAWRQVTTTAYTG